MNKILKLQKELKQNLRMQLIAISLTLFVLLLNLIIRIFPSLDIALFEIKF